MKNKHMSLMAAGRKSRAAARVSTVLGICFLLGLGLTCRSHAQIVLCGPLFEFYSATVRANAAGVEESGANPAEFIFEIVGGSPISGTTLTLQISGTASNGVDYQTISTQVTLPGGPSPRVTRAVVPIADAIVEGTETVTVRIIASSNTNCIPIGTPNEATISITELSLAEAVDNTDLLWTTGGDGLWSPQTAVTKDGVDATQSGAIGDSQESWLQTTVTGPGTLAFWWKVSTEMDYDLIEFSLDGVVQSRISGEEDWTQPSFAIPAGSHPLRWRYYKDEFTGLGQDTAWLDEVVFLPDAGPAVILAQPSPMRTGLGDTVTLVAGVGGGIPRSYQWFKDGELITGAVDTSLTLSDAGTGDAATYFLVTSNALGSATSSNAVLSVTINGFIETVLLFADQSFSPYQTALNNLGLSYQSFADPIAFNTAVDSADPASTLVVVGALLPNMTLNPVARFANSGGRVLMQYWGLSTAGTLATAFNASVQEVLFVTPPIYDWGGSPFFDGLTSPILRSDIYFYNGQRLQPIAGGQAVAGYDSVPMANSAAIVTGHSGRTILNGFNLEEFNDFNAQVRLAENEIAYLLGPPPPSVVLFSESFDADTSANWVVNQSSADTRVTFNYDYSTDGIPSAPNSVGGSTRGVKFEANLSSGLLAALNISPAGQSFAGDYRLEFDMWINVNGPLPGGGAGSTEFFTAGVGVTNDATSYLAGVSSGGGGWFAVSGEGGSSRDFRAYKHTAEQFAESGQFAAGTSSAGADAGNAHNASNPYYTSRFPGGQTAPLLQQTNYAQQTGALGLGTVGFAWRQVEMIRQGDRVQWSIDGLRIASLDANIGSSFSTTGNVFVGYMDIFTSISDNPALSFGLVDNVQVKMDVTNFEMLSPVWTNGGFQIVLSGPPGLPCSLQESTNLVHWITVTNISLSGDSMLITVPALADRGFYRAVTPPVP